MKAGTYTATLENYYTERSKNDTLVLVLVFNIEGEKLRYYLHDTEGSWERLFKTLEVMDYDGFNIETLAEGPATGLLNTAKPYRVKVVENVYNGKTSPKIIGVYNETISPSMSVHEASALTSQSGVNRAWAEYKSTSDKV